MTPLSLITASSPSGLLFRKANKVRNENWHAAWTAQWVMKLDLFRRFGGGFFQTLTVKRNIWGQGVVEAFRYSGSNFLRPLCRVESLSQNEPAAGPTFQKWLALVVTSWPGGMQNTTNYEFESFFFVFFYFIYSIFLVLLPLRSSWAIIQIIKWLGELQQKCSALSPLFRPPLCGFLILFALFPALSLAIEKNTHEELGSMRLG